MVVVKAMIKVMVTVKSMDFTLAFVQFIDVRIHRIRVCCVR